MLVNDFDDEHTLDEEEAQLEDSLNTKEEIDELEKVSFVFPKCLLLNVFFQCRKKICL